MNHFDHVEKYKDRFLQFGQNYDIETHFTIQKIGVSREMNHLAGEGFGICCLMYH